MYMSTSACVCLRPGVSTTRHEHYHLRNTIPTKPKKKKNTEMHQETRVESRVRAEGTIFFTERMHVHSARVDSNGSGGGGSSSLLLLVPRRRRRRRHRCCALLLLGHRPSARAHGWRVEKHDAHALNRCDVGAKRGVKQAQAQTVDDDLKTNRRKVDGRQGRRRRRRRRSRARSKRCSGATGGAAAFSGG